MEKSGRLPSRNLIGENTRCVDDEPRMDGAAVSENAADRIPLHLHAGDDGVKRNLRAVFHGVFRQRNG